MKMKMKIRDVHTITVSEFLKLEVSDFSMIRLTNPLLPNSGRPFDIGSLFYCRREPQSERKNGKSMAPTLVDINSKRSDRGDLVKSIAELLFNHNPKSQIALIKGVIYICDWMDSNDHESFHSSKEAMIEAYFSFIHDLLKRIRVKNHAKPLEPISAQNRQIEIRQLIRVLFPDDHSEIISGAPIIKKTRKNRKGINENLALNYWDINFVTFKEFSNSCYSNIQFPPKIKIGDIDSYFIPSNNFSNVDSCWSIKPFAPYFNYSTGKVRSYEEVEDHYKKRTDYKRHLLTWYNIVNCNRSYFRIGLAVKALQSFVQLFRILTAANGSIIRNLEYDDGFETERDFTKKDFRDVKFRANNREVVLRLHQQGFKLFKDYLKLRKWLLNGVYCKYLFFSLGENYQQEPKSLGEKFNVIHYDSLKRNGLFSPSLQTLSDKELRSVKTIILRKLGFSAKAVADSNNHSVEIANQVYARPSLNSQIEELSSYWQACEKIAASVVTNEKIKPTVSGGCTTQDAMSKAIYDNPPIEPNCSIPQSCFFCIYYSIHADKEDVFKLFSVLFVLKEIRLSAIDFEHADELYLALILRIEYIISEISSRSENSKVMVDAIKTDVFEYGELTLFWNKRLTYLEKSGVVKI